MDRRDFIRIAGAGSASLALPGAISNALANATGNPWRAYEVTTRVEMLKPVGVTRVWLPLTLSVDTTTRGARNLGGDSARRGRGRREIRSRRGWQHGPRREACGVAGALAPAIAR